MSIPVARDASPQEIESELRIRKTWNEAPPGSIMNVRLGDWLAQIKKTAKGKLFEITRNGGYSREMYSNFESWRFFMPRDINGTLRVRTPKPPAPPPTEFERLKKFQTKLRIKRPVSLWYAGQHSRTGAAYITTFGPTRLFVLRGDKMIFLGVSRFRTAGNVEHPYDYQDAIVFGDQVGKTFEEVGLTAEDLQNLWHVPPRGEAPRKVVLPA